MFHLSWNILLEACKNYQFCTCKLVIFPSKMFTWYFQPNELAANHLCNNLMNACNCMLFLSQLGKTIRCSQTGRTVSQSGITNVMCPRTRYTEVQKTVVDFKP